MATDGQHRSALKEFIASIATIKGDLSNITAPPFVLADKSTTELPRFWISHPSLFTAPASQETPEARLLAVVKWFIASLKDQQHAGRDPKDGIKKPLNAFLGEVFLGECGDKSAPARLVSEQVSHHPPVTACYLWADEAGVRAEGFTRQTITFGATGVTIKQSGQAVLTLDKLNEHYLIPLPEVKVKGVLTGSPYPEITEDVEIAASNGCVATVHFSGKSVLGLAGQKNSVEAKIYTADDAKARKSAAFSISGSWTESFDIKDASGSTVEKYNVAGVQPEEFRLPSESEQDPWESRNAWGPVMKAIHAGDMQGVADNKSKLEQAQRELRKRSDTSEENWKPLFFRKDNDWPEAEQLLAAIGEKLDRTSACGIWRYDAANAAQMQRPWRGDLTPFG